MTDDDTRAAIMTLLRRGDITMSEAARSAGVSRQRVAQWCAAAGMNGPAVRQARVGRMVSAELQRQSGKPVRKKSKAELRSIHDQVMGGKRRFAPRRRKMTDEEKAAIKARADENPQW